MDGIRRERDEMSVEVLRLRAQLDEYERMEVEYADVKRRLAECEEVGLRHAREVIRARDETIDDLSGKLQQALDQLAIERAQRQRRQIIFPSHPKEGS